MNPAKSFWDDPTTIDFSTIYKKIWAPLLIHRAYGFHWMFEQLEKMDKSFYCIVETGCMRDKYRKMDFAKDGCSTLLFDRFVQKMGGMFESVDCSVEAVQYAREFVAHDNTSIYLNDSILFLRNRVKYGGPIDLLYLDSMDYDKESPGASEMHHLYELTASMRMLKRGSIVMVDDNYSDGTGKGRLVRQFFTEYGLIPAFEPQNFGRHLGWIIP